MCCHAHLLPALSGINAPSYTGGVTPLRLPALTLRGYLHVVQDGSAFFPRAFGLVRRVVLFSNGMRPLPSRHCPRSQPVRHLRLLWDSTTRRSNLTGDISSVGASPAVCQAGRCKHGS